MNRVKLSLLSLLVLILFASACSSSLAEEATTAAVQTTAATTDTPEPTHTPTPIPTHTLMPTPTSEPEYPTHDDVPYVDDGISKHQLDVYLPPGGDGPYPTLFMIHGLNFNDNNDTFFSASEETLHHLAAYFAERGYAVVSIDYQWPSEPFQQQMTRDAFCALAWMQTNAEVYGFDAQRIAILGEYWGAATATKLGAVDDPGPFLEGCPHPEPEPGWIDGIVTYGGHFDTPEAYLNLGTYLTLFAKSHGTQSEVPYKELERIFETLSDLSPQEWREKEGLDEKASKIAPMLPLYWIDGSEPPFLLIDGTYDLGVLYYARGEQHPAESEAFASELQVVGVDVELLQLADAQYNSLRTKELTEQVVQAIEAFLDDLFE